MGTYWHPISTGNPWPPMWPYVSICILRIRFVHSFDDFYSYHHSKLFFSYRLGQLSFIYFEFEHSPLTACSIHFSMSRKRSSRQQFRLYTSLLHFKVHPSCARFIPQKKKRHENMLCVEYPHLISLINISRVIDRLQMNLWFNILLTKLQTTYKVIDHYTNCCPIVDWNLLWI